MKKILFSLVLLAVTPSLWAQSATITWTATNQTMDGFGAFGGTSTGTGAFTSSQADFLFSTTVPGGIGLSLMRMETTDGPGSTTPGDCSSVSTSCAGLPDNLANMQAAAARGATVWASEWSPPASMKTNSSTHCSANGSTGSLSSGSYSAYATWLSNFISSVKTYAGVSLYAISPQNEPDACPSSYDGANWTDANFFTFIKTNLAPILAANGQSAVKIVFPESGDWGNFTNYTDSCMADAGCASDVGILAWHDYYNHPTITNPYSGGQRFWETEASAGPGYGPSLCGGCFDPSMGDGLLWAQIIHSRLAGSNANAWHWWRGVNTFNDNEGLLNTNPSVNPSGVIPKHTYVLGNWSKYVRPGWVRIDATANPAAGIYVTAFKEASSGNFAIVAINQNSSPINVNFSLSGFPSVTSLTPTLTSASVNLVDQANTSVSGSAFAYSLPAMSVVTFHGTSSSSSATTPLPPTSLTAIIR